MTTKADFTPEEWNLLMMAPTHTAMYIVEADPNLMGVLTEIKSTAKYVEESLPPASASELIGALKADFQAQAESTEQAAAAPPPADADPAETTRQSLAQIAALVDTKCSSEEAAGFKQWLVGAARAAAEAGKEGGFLGIGGKRVSDKEQAALAELNTILKR